MCLVLLQVVAQSELGYIGASLRAAGREPAAYSSNKLNATFSIRVDPLDSALCLGASNVDLQWSLKRASWLPSLWAADSKQMVAHVAWKPLLVAAAAGTVGKGG